MSDVTDSAAGPRVAVYTENLVVTPNSKIALTKWAEALTDPDYKKMCLDALAAANMASDIAAAGFNTIIVGLFHVHAQGQIFYNNFPVATGTAGAIYEGINALRTAPGSTVHTITVSFGGGGGPPSVSDDDYPNIKNNWAVFEPALLDLLKKAGANGVDWDYEPYPMPFDTDLIIKLTNEISAAGYAITAAPYGQLHLQLDNRDRKHAQRGRE